MPIDSDGSLIDLSGTIRHFSEDAFAALAQDCSRCFLCGVPKSIVPFNDEHVVPDWVLRRFGLHGASVTLPNLTTVRYGQYKLRCCKPCNSLLSREVEKPISELFRDDFDVLKAGLSAPNNCLVYQWLCLLFIKTHLKDRDLRADRDRRNPSPQLSALYDWGRLHHIHTVARAAKSRTSIDPDVPGTVLLFEMAPGTEPFDYGDIYDHSTIFVRIGRIGVVAVLNDCAAAGFTVTRFLSGIKGPLANIQLREIAARAAYGNEILLSRPRFRTELHEGRDLFMKCELPDGPQYGEVDARALGALLEYSCATRIQQSATPNKEEMISRLAKGEMTLLYDDDGEFIMQSPLLKPEQGDA